MGPLNRERRAHGALGVVLLRPRIAEERHEPIAESLEDMPAVRRHRLGRRIEIDADQVAQVLGVELRSKGRRADEIAEHEGDRAALGGTRAREMLRR
jgi:hypothetical protein